MAKKQTILVGFLTLVILLSSIYIFQGNVKLEVFKDKTVFKVLEDSKWVVSGEERLFVINGSTSLKRLSSTVNYTILPDNQTIIYRYSTYKNNISILSIYEFNGSNKDVSRFPLKETHQIINANGLRLKYELSKLTIIDSSEITNPMIFGKNMKLAYDNGDKSIIYDHVDKKFTIFYNVYDNNSTYNIRFFDPTNFTQNLSVYLSMNGQLTDQTGNGHSGTLVGSTVYTARGYNLNGTYYDGVSDAVTIADNDTDPWDNMPEITINIWINKTDALDSRVAHMNGVWSILASAGSPGEVRWRVYNSTGATYEYDTNAMLSAAGVWDMITVTYSPGNFTIFVNGVNEGSVAGLGGNIRDLAVPIYLGLDEDGSTYDFKGQLDEFGIWTYKMSDAQVLELYELYTSGYTPFIDPPPPNITDYNYYWNGTSLCSEINGWCMYDNFSTTLNLNGSFYFNQSENQRLVNFTSNSICSKDNNFSISMWFYGIPFSFTDELLHCNGGIDGNDYISIVSLSTGSYLSAGIQNAGGTWQDAVSSTILNNYTWHHVVVTWDGTDIKMYLNNVTQSGTQTAASGVAPGMSFGASTSTNGDGTPYYPYNGGIDDIKIWDRTLTFVEATILYGVPRTAGPEGSPDINVSISTSASGASAWEVYNDTSSYLVFRCGSTETECEAENQIVGTKAIFLFCNNGTLTANNVSMYMNATIPNIDLKCGSIYASAPIITATVTDVYGSLAVDECQGIYCWADFNSPSVGGFFDVHFTVD
jgi:hypothetical protein